MTSFLRSVRLSGCSAVLLAGLLCPSLFAAECGNAENCSEASVDAPPEGSPAPPSSSNSSEYAKKDKRIFGVLPNYRTTDGAVPFSPLTSRQKLGIAARDTFDWPTFLLTGVFASAYPAENQNPAFGQGMQGYAKRYSAALGDQMIGNMMVEGFLPVFLHEDPRYFRSGSGTAGSRLKSALRQIVMARSDSGSWRFNTAEWMGNGIAMGISNTYYSDSRTLSANLQRFGMQIGTDALSNVLKEFWPDIKQRFFQKHQMEHESSTAGLQTEAGQ